MSEYDYLIVGGGQVSDDASRGIREHDEHGSIGILSADVDEPYTRPALSKKLWTDEEFGEDQVPLGTAADTGAEIRLGVRVTAIDREAKEVELSDGERVGYGRLLLATGSEPSRLKGPEDDRIIAFRSFADYRRLRRLAEPGRHALVVGGGYIGTELAAALTTQGLAVTVVSPDAVLGGSTFPADIARRFHDLFTEHGVHALTGRRAERVDRGDDDRLAVVLDDDTSVETDIVVVGLGAAPVLDLAREAGLEVSDGVVVDARLRTEDPSIWAAGDIAEYPDAVLGRTRIEHIDHARESGAAAGRSMAGSDAAYEHTPYFYSVVFGVSWEAVGTLDPALDIHQVDLDEDRSVVYYRDEYSRPVGVLLWQVEDACDAARQVIADGPADTSALDERIR